MRYYYLLIFLVLTAFCSYAQKDFLIDEIGDNLNEDFGKAYQYYYSNKDSTYFYFNRVKQTANKYNFIEYQLEALIRESWAASFHNDLYIIKENIQQLDSIQLNNKKELDTIYLKNYYTSSITYTKGLYEYDLNNYKPALMHFNEFIRTCEENQNYFEDTEILKLYLSATTFVGKLYVNEGKYKLAKDFYEKTLRTINQKTGFDMSFSNNIQILLADIHQKEGQFEKANASILKVLHYYIDVTKNSNRIITSYQRIIDNHLKLKQTDSAIYYLQKMKPFVTEAHPLFDRYYTSSAHISEAEGNYAEAEVDLQTVIDILKANPQSIENNKLAQAYQEMGSLHMKFNQPKKALVQYQVADQNLKKNKTTINQTKYLQLLKHKTQALNSLELYNPSLETTHEAIAILDALKPTFKNNSDKLFLIDDAFPVFESALEANFKLYQETQQDSLIDTAFYYSEKSKSVLLMEALLSTKATEFANIPNQIIEEEQILKSRITYLEKQLNTAKNTDLEAELFDTQNSYRELITKIETDYKTYYDLKYNSEVISLPELQKFLKPNTALISYFYGNDAIYSITITKNSKAIQQLKRDAVLDEAIISVYNMLNNPKSDLEALNNKSFQLYSQFVAPSIENVSEKNIIIIADGLLNYLPFSSLSVTGSTEYLVENRAISYVNSATLLQQLSDGESINNKVLAFAPSFDGQDTNNLLSLPNNKNEATDILNYFNGKTLTDSQATLQNFNTESADFGLLHFATHAILDDENPEYSYLAFQPDGNSNLLYVSDLYNLNSNTSLVTLSACESGMGDLKRGEGFISLARGFYFSGAKSIASTLWKINDGSSSKIMDAFYKNLSEGDDKNVALQKAQSAFIHDNSQNALAHPYYWSGFVISGNMQAIETTNNWMWYTLGTLSFLVLLFLFIKRRKSN